MEFPITELLDHENSAAWILKHFPPKGLKCPKCKRGVEQSRKFRRTQTSELEVHRCKHCGTIYNLYTGTVFQGSQWTSMRVVLLMRGICKGETTRKLAAELQLNHKTVLTIRYRVQANAELEQPNTALPDSHSETDEMFQSSGKKGELHPDPDDPPRKRANKQRGHGTYDNDRPPIVGTGKRAGALTCNSQHRPKNVGVPCSSVYVERDDLLYR